MKPEFPRNADDGKSKNSTDALSKPLLPSRIPKKPKKTSGRINPRGPLDLKRPFSATLGVKETDRRVLPSGKEATTTPVTTTPERKLSNEATELVGLIPTLSGVDVSRLVASIKRRRLQRSRGDQAKTTQRVAERTLTPTTQSTTADPMSVTTKTEETYGIDRKAL